MWNLASQKIKISSDFIASTIKSRTRKQINCESVLSIYLAASYLYQEKIKNYCSTSKKKKYKTNKIIQKSETNSLNIIKNPRFLNNNYDETFYYFENNLRKVYPYYFTFTRFTKGSWVGEKALDVFVREFRADPKADYEKHMRDGTLSVNYVSVKPDYRLRHNDLLSKSVHRHEDPVANILITFIHINEDFVVINKPPSIPVYPCGRYRYNTILFILAKDYNLKNLYSIHRIDKQTSGLLILGRNSKIANKISQQFKDKVVYKEYLCKVNGEFPNEKIECHIPIKMLKYRIPVSIVSTEGKDCSTEFKRLNYDKQSNTSVVLCQPRTGRQHQIRVHLQYLGYPIVNDPLYNHPAFGTLRGKGGYREDKSEEQLIKDLCVANYWRGVNASDTRHQFSACPDIVSVKQEGYNLSPPSEQLSIRFEAPANFDTPLTAHLICTEKSSTNLDSPSAVTLFQNFTKNAEIDLLEKATPLIPPDKIANKANIKYKIESVDVKKATATKSLSFDPECYECRVRHRDPNPEDLMLYLHAWKYSGPGWMYKTELPQWVDVDKCY